jgi:hypothetical protein
MSLITFEATVEDGHIRLPSDVRLPNHTRVYVLVPDPQAAPVARVISPRLVHPEQAADFQMQVGIETADAGL